MILIVGATGDLVRRVVRRLRERDESVRALVRAKTDAGQLQLQGVDVVGGDLTNPASLPDACEGVTTVVLTATANARRLAGGRVSIYDVDQVGGLALVNAAESAGVKRTRPAQRADRSASKPQRKSLRRAGFRRVSCGSHPGTCPDIGRTTGQG